MTLGLPAGTPIQWAGNHRFHHAHADRPGDPHSPRDGFWHAHNGWYIGRRDAATCIAYALAGPLRVLFDGWHRPRSNQQHNHLAEDVAADPWYRFVSRPGPYLALAVAHVAIFFGGAFAAFGGPGVACLWLTLIVVFNLGDAIDSMAHIVGRAPRTPAPIWRATIGSSACSAWAKAGTPTTTASPGAPATAWNRDSWMEPG